MRTPKILLAALLLGSLSGSAIAQVPTGALNETRTTLEAWFLGYEFVPTATHYKALGPALGPALTALAFDDTAHLLQRARAVSSMVHAPSDLTEAALVRLVETEGTPSMLQRKAVLALTDVWGAKHLALVVSVFSEARADLRLREACARALRSMGPIAHPARDRLLRLEKAPTVRGLLLETKRVGATD
jgi:hypothetical protein